MWYGLNVKDAIENFPLIERISGSVKLWQYAVLSHANETVMIHANSVNGSVFEMQIKAKEKVNLKLASNTPDVKFYYDEAAECYVFSFLVMIDRLTV